MPVVTRLRELLGTVLTEGDRRAGADLASLVALTVLSQASALATVVLLGRGLSGADFGRFSSAHALQSYLLLLGVVGTRQVVVRELARHPARLDALATTYLAVTGTCSAALALALAAWTGTVELPSGEGSLLVLFAAGNVGSAMSPVPLFDARDRQVSAALIAGACELVALVAVVSLSLWGALTLTRAGLVYATKWTVVSAIQLVVFHRSIERLRPRFDAGLLKSVLGASLPLLVSSLAATIPLTMGVLLVRVLRGPGEAALMGLAAQVTVVYVVFATLGHRIALPHVARRHGRERGFGRKVAVFYALFLGALGLAVVGAAATAIALFLPDAYRAAIPPAAVMVCGAAVISAGRVVQMYLVVLGRETHAMTAVVAGAVVFVGGCLAVVPERSVDGAAGVMVVSALVGTGILSGFLARALRTDASVP